MDWLAEAEQLPTGHNVRIDCVNECGGGKTMVVNHHSSHYSCYCHRCGYKTGRSKGYQTLEQLARTREQDKLAHAQAGTLALPKDIEYDFNLWTTEARMWLYKASIYGHRITSNNIGYSPSLNRVVLPTYVDNALAYYQMRKLSGQGAKYINPRVDKSSLIHYCGDRDSRSIVICEDILSTIRVGTHTRAASLLGTKISTAQAGLLSTYDTIYTWLDNDKAGIDGAIAYKRALQLLGVKVININTPLDPKEYSDDEIKSILQEHQL